MHAFLPGLHAELFPNTEAPTPAPAPQRARARPDPLSPPSLDSPAGPQQQQQQQQQQASPQPHAADGGRSERSAALASSQPLGAPKSSYSPVEALDASGQYVVVGHPSNDGGDERADLRSPLSASSAATDDARGHEAAGSTPSSDTTLHPHPIVL